MGPVAPRHVGSSQTRARTRVPCISRQILNHCATREALFLIKKLLENSLVVPWLGLGALAVGDWVQSLVRELRSRELCGTAQKKIFLIEVTLVCNII